MSSIVPMRIALFRVIGVPKQRHFPSFAFERFKRSPQAISTHG
jgi:hypothetical protein